MPLAVRLINLFMPSMLMWYSGRFVFVIVACLVVAAAVDSASEPKSIASHQNSQPWDDWGNAQFNLSQVQDKFATLTSISRADVITRAKEWTEKKMPYCQCNGPEECCGECPYCDKYRCDCSGCVLVFQFFLLFIYP